MLKLIVAVDRNYAIGKGNKLLATSKEDMSRFRRLTTGGVVIMGRNTWESIPDKRRPLKDRKNIVVTHRDLEDLSNPDVIVTDDIDKLIKDYAYGVMNAWVIGGASIYDQFIDNCNAMYITIFNKSYDDADVFFPMDKKDHRWDDWHLSYSFNGVKPESDNEPMCRYLLYEREMVSRR